MAGPFSKTVQTLPSGARGAEFEAAGSTSVAKTGWKTFCASRRERTTCTGSFGQGKRSDSGNVRATLFGSPVVSHSAYSEE